MKNYLKIIIYWIFRLWSYIYSQRINNNINKFIAFGYTGWLSRFLGTLGKNALIYPPLYLLGGKYIFIGNNFSSGRRLRLDAFDKYENQHFSPQIIIGDNVSLQNDCHIGAIHKITIGNNVLIASKVFISDTLHGDTTIESLNIPPSKRKLVSKGEIVIEDNVWIGEGVVILPNVTIGKNSIIGSNAVVSKNVPENSIVGGIPAKIIKTIS